MDFYSHINFIPFLAAVVVYFAIGALWFSALFGKQWVALTEIKMTDTVKQSVGKMFALTFLINVVICYATASIVHLVRPATIYAAVRLGALLGIGFMAAPCTMNYMYARRTFRLTMIDAGYHVVSILVVTVLLSMWH